MTYQINVYKIWWENDPVNFYVGSTKRPLSSRMGEHRACARKGKPAKIYRTMREKGINSFQYVLLGSYQVNNNDEKRKHEQRFIDELNPTLNMVSAIDTCTHGRKQALCKDCGGSQICQHNRQRHTCKACGGVGICQHNRRRNACKECGGASICEHDRQRNRCKECGGASICEHKKQKDQCKPCNGDKYHCYECDKTLCSKYKLKLHNRTRKHKDNYKAMFREVFEMEIEDEEIPE